MSEAEKIYFAIFKRKIPLSIYTHFENISKKINDKYTDEEIKRYYDYIAKIHDIEALELAARYFKKLHILTEKFKIMVYLAETLPENYSVFVSEKNSILSGYLSIAVSIFRTVYKLTKGSFLLMVYRI